MNLIKSIQQKFHATCIFGAGLSIALMFGIIFVNSVRRYSTGKSFVWGEELPVYLAVYGFMFGIAAIYLQGRHVQFSILNNALPEFIMRWRDVAIDISVVVIGGMLSYSGWVLVIKRGQFEASSIIGASKDLAEATGLTILENLGLMSSWLFSISFGGALLVCAACFKLVDHFVIAIEKKF